MFFGGYDDDNDEIEETSSKTDELENFEDVVPELDLGEPPDELKEYARQYIGESPDTRSSILQEFKDMIYERGEVVPHRTDEAFLIRFLRARRFQAEKAHRLWLPENTRVAQRTKRMAETIRAAMVNYYNFKQNNPEIHKSLNPLNVRHIGDDNVVSVYPYREQTGRRIMIYKIGNWNPDNYSIEELFKATVVILELAVMEQRAQILGGICIFDLGGITLQHAWQITPTIARMAVELLVTSFPIRTHAIHIINESWIFDTIFTIFKPFLDDRMKEKIHFHGQDLESLHSHIDPKFLPKAYGGWRPEYRYTDWVVNLIHNKNIMAELTQIGFVFDAEEVMKVLEEAKTEVSRNTNVIMTR